VSFTDAVDAVAAHATGEVELAAGLDQVGLALVLADRSGAARRIAGTTGLSALRLGDAPGGHDAERGRQGHPEQCR
jgi:hypothetical protein